MASISIQTSIEDDVAKSSYYFSKYQLLRSVRHPYILRFLRMNVVFLFHNIVLGMMNTFQTIIKKYSC